MCTPKGKTHSREAENGGFQNERENSKADCRDEEPDHRGRGGDEQHHPPEGSEGCRYLLRHGQIREYRRPQRVQHLERMGCGWARVEIPEGCFHCGAGRAEMRTGYPDPDLRRYRNPAGSFATTERKAMPAGAAASTSILGRRATRRRAFGTLPTSWRATKA